MKTVSEANSVSTNDTGLTRLVPSGTPWRYSADHRWTY